MSQNRNLYIYRAFSIYQVIMMVHTSKAKKKEMPVSPVRSRLSAFASKFFDKRTEAKLENVRRESQITRRAALRTLATALGIGVVASCAPAAVLAEPKKPAQETAETKKGVEYQVFTDPKELEPYFKNAEGRYVNIKPDAPTKIGAYELLLTDGGTGVAISIWADGKKQTHSVGLASPLNEINILVVDMPKDSPMFRGTTLVFADHASVFFQYFDKVRGVHALRGVPLAAGGMRPGKIRTGFEITSDGLEIVNTPEKLVKGDKFTLAYFDNDGVSGGNFFKYEGPDVDLLAMAPTGKAQF